MAANTYRAAETLIIQHINNFNPESEDALRLSRAILKAQQYAGDYWHQMAYSISKQADLTKLGLSTGDELIGVKNNSLLVKGEKDGRIHFFDPVRITGKPLEEAVPPEAVVSGNNRTFNLYADGRLEYRVQDQDPGARGNDREHYSNIARDALKALTGKDVTELEVYNFLGQMQRANLHVNFNVIEPGQVLQIPIHAHSEELHADGKSLPESEKKNPPKPFEGLSASGETDATIANARKAEYGGPNGTKITRTEGALLEGSFFGHGARTPVIRTDIADQQGNLVGRNLQYNNGKTVDLVRADGQKVTVENVKEVDLKWDYVAGMYNGTLRTRDGQTHCFSVDRYGKVARAAITAA